MYSLPARIEKIVVETEDGLIKSFYLKPIEGALPLPRPGQFAMLSVPGKGECPIGIASAPHEEYWLFSIFRTGLVTDALHRLPEGTIIGLRGPLGNGYPLEKFREKNIVLIAGGFAITTLRATLVYLLKHRQDYGEVTMIYGARNPGLLLYKNELNEWQKREDLNLYLTVDVEAPGWEGLVGFVPQITEKVAPQGENAVALVCGPPVMIKFTLPILEKLGFSPENIYLSLENRMRCGLGLCRHCNVGPALVCKDGPVFSLSELKRLPPEY
ncbi:oxidoreductase FAD/NAD(P)-binding domain protein [Thermodesulfatator indicus DSM 15286]|uniref:Oxidoreductase FAD/NAD(P)-binding domain protein n=1 Tax=Thermodesulfatator indicus (strain DSM 15286 / JCM 11887 / CIR29812) TaxID=667014 RepID=F8ADA8_THEID|nr:FAD/NAD(P)-binding protein [Thermodesulfatator indicus]AEH45923.1 oxidoreductase FAD/NAD(P)-binding domain protein [Thermodesulfatator indicus DSM 15286]